MFTFEQAIIDPSYRSWLLYSRVCSEFYLLQLIETNQYAISSIPTTCEEVKEYVMEYNIQFHE